MPHAPPQPLDRPRADVVVTKALRNASARLGLSQRELAEVVGVSPATMSRVVAGERTIPSDTKEEELALLFLRVFRSLDALVGGDEAQARAWLRAENRHLGGVPLEWMRQVQGLVRVAEYLDALRGKV
ncbi:DUF2384 domain-containing protein [Myxococcota bacterium]|nr:DUF2384 domain-containing protein [Myxococcota bacterium]